MYTIVKRYYDKGIYTVENVRSFVKAGKLTAEGFKNITGEDY